NAGLGKGRYDSATPSVRLGQAVLQGTADLSSSLSAVATLSAGDRPGARIDVREAWLSWDPVPDGAWKWSAKAGSFFPRSSLEVEYGGIGWTPTQTVSSSAINSWIGEELRTNGLELQLKRIGRLADSPHDIGLSAAIFRGNDPTGTLLAWRGWSISDRISGAYAAIPLAPLPVYQADGAIPRQAHTIHPFREIDGRAGYYIGANYRYRERFELAWMDYDNRANPLAVKQGQYGWRTRFTHWSLRLRPHDNWELLVQLMHGDTLMGQNAVALDFRAAYALISHPLGPGRVALRYDRFSTREHDLLPSDPNAERGRSVALAYSLALSDTTTLVTELLTLDSTRAARALLALPTRQREHSVVTSLRWQF
ncbi:MAG: hypothetical protein ACEQSK_16965, partial [Sphingomonadaceae bacterium]